MTAETVFIPELGAMGCGGIARDCQADAQADGEAEGGVVDQRDGKSRQRGAKAPRRGRPTGFDFGQVPRAIGCVSAPACHG